jgi:hypothetical protein
LRCRAEVDGSHLFVTRLRIWTSYVEHAEYCKLLVPAEPEAKRHLA